MYVCRDLALDVLSKAVVAPDLRDWEVHTYTPTVFFVTGAIYCVCVAD